jgi:hypothetical protein
MARDEVLALYRPIRASIRRILSLAVPVCNRADFTRAAKQLGLWANGKILLPDDDNAPKILSDVALFEPNQHDRRAFDRFLSERARQLDAADLELAQRMGKAFFSLFRCTGRHETAGVWLDDLLDGDRRLWLMDEAVEASAPKGATFGMRLFDAGAFQVGFGIVAPADEETIEFSVQGKTRNGRLPFRHSLAATLYGDSLRDGLPLAPDVEKVFASLLGRLIKSGAGSGRALGSLPPLRKLRPRRRN